MKKRLDSDHAQRAYISIFYFGLKFLQEGLLWIFFETINEHIIKKENQIYQEE